MRSVEAATSLSGGRESDPRIEGFGAVLAQPEFQADQSGALEVMSLVDRHAMERIIPAAGGGSESGKHVRFAPLAAISLPISEVQKRVRSLITGKWNWVIVRESPAVKHKSTSVTTKSKDISKKGSTS